MSAIPRGVYEDLITIARQDGLREVEARLVERANLDPIDAHDVLARHIAVLARRAFRSVAGNDEASVSRQVELANRIATSIIDAAPSALDANEIVTNTKQLLLAVVDAAGVPGPVTFPVRPDVPFSASALLVNGRDQPRIGHEIGKELASADGVDLICAFIKWHGLRIIDAQLQEFVQRGGRLRVITTTYIGATERRALDRLVQVGAEVKISYETMSTRLHAKAWMFHRRTGLATAYVGSSNMSKTALIDGLEWNVRLSSVEQSHLLRTFEDTFENYWAEPSFELYDPSKDGSRLDTALQNERRGPAQLPLQITSLDVRPYGYQQEILEELDAERKIHDRWRNLVVMATGTGKTVVAALDYRRLSEAGIAKTLLFVAHREEILAQSQSTFRQVLRRGDFGERFVGGDRPTDWNHVFASIQSLANVDLEALSPTRFDVVIVDEFHHAMAKSYSGLLSHLQPKVLLGLTATPERADGTDIRSWFGGKTAVELRLWEALERGLLAPFHYFGMHDDVALGALAWKRGRGYEPLELEKLYTGNDHRVRLILQAVRDKVTDVGTMRALGFCVSIGHAEFMARKFKAAGIPSLAVTSRTDPDSRKRALRDLDERRVNVLFTVDLFNEGIDLPAIDTVLFLRPTESATIFLQQLGRGLRLAAEKPCLTVLDFIGAQHQDFRFDLRYRALTGSSRTRLIRQVEDGFPLLPSGCHIELDRVAQRLVLENIRQSLRVPWKTVVAELREIGECSLTTFLDETGMEVDDLYRSYRGGWPAMRRGAGLPTPEPGPDDTRLGRAMGRILHIDDLERLLFISKVMSNDAAVLAPSERSRRLSAMWHFALGGSSVAISNVEQELKQLLAANPSRRSELQELSGVLIDRIHRVTPALEIDAQPLHIHARYSRNEALAAFGMPNPDTVREGVKWLESENADVFFVTLRKTESHFSPTTMYADHAISPDLFQWESQSTTSERSATGQRYINHQQRGSSVHLFIRETKASDGALGAPPYLYAGPMTYVDHSGERPMKIVWKLDQPLPADVFHAAKVA